MKHGLLVTFFGTQRDRFCTYQRPLTVTEKLERAARVPGVTGVELIFPDECRDRSDLPDVLRQLNLLPAAININIKGHQRFVCGALSSPDPQVRRAAVETIAEAKEFAQMIGCERVTCAPLADGYDYPFQLNYASAWARMVESLQEAAEHIPEVTLHIEHKPADPRTCGLLASPSKVLRLCKDVGRSGLGITFNVGHSLYGGGWPAAEFTRVSAAGVPCYIHHNDGAVEWDWDLMPGSQSFWLLVELLYFIKESGYEGWFTADTLPLRQDAVEFFAANVRVTDQIWNWFDSPGWRDLRETIRRGGTHLALRELAKWVCQTEI